MNCLKLTKASYSSLTTLMTSKNISKRILTGG